MKRVAVCENANDSEISAKKMKNDNDCNIIFESGGEGLNFFNFNPNLDFDIGKPVEDVLKPVGEEVLKSVGVQDFPFDQLKLTMIGLPILKQIFFPDASNNENLDNEILSCDTSKILRSEMDVYDPLSSKIYIDINDNSDILTNFPVAKIPVSLYILHLMESICQKSSFDDLSTCNIIMSDKSINFTLTTITILQELMKKLVDLPNNNLDKFLASINRFKDDPTKGGEFLSKAFTFEKDIPITKFVCISSILTNCFAFATKIVELKRVELIALGLLCKNSLQDFSNIYNYLNPLVNNAVGNGVNNAVNNGVENRVENRVENTLNNPVYGVNNDVITFTTHPPEHEITNKNFDVKMNFNNNITVCGEKIIVKISLINKDNVDISDEKTKHLKADKTHLDLNGRKDGRIYFLSQNQTSLNIEKIKIQSNHGSSITSTCSNKYTLFIRAELFKCVNGREFSMGSGVSNPFCVYSHKKCMNEENQKTEPRQPNRISCKPEISKLIPESGTINSEITIIGNFNSSNSIILEINGRINTNISRMYSQVV